MQAGFTAYSLWERIVYMDVATFFSFSLYHLQANDLTLQLVIAVMRLSAVLFSVLSSIQSPSLS